MNRNIIRLAVAAVACAGTVAALGLPAGAVPDTRSGSAPDAIPAAAPDTTLDTGKGAGRSGMLEAMRRDLGLDAAEAKQRLANDIAASRTEGRLRAALGGSFGGAWVNDAGTLIVGTTDRAEFRTIRAAGAEPRAVTYTEDALTDVAAGLGEASRAPASIPGWYVDVRTNQVVVQAAPTARSAARGFVAASGVDRGAVRIEPSTERPRPLYDVRGGDAYYIGGSGRCSIGFPVRGGFATAGHCGRTGTSIAGYNRVALGQVAGSTFPGRDYGWVRITNSQWVSRPWVNDYRGGVVTVRGSQESAVGSAICRSGSTTGWHCGYVQAKNQTVRYSQGAVYGLTRTNVCAEPGDSGGSWLTGQQAQGVTSGGSGNCRTGGTTYFQPLNPILSAYGLSLMTG